MERTWSQRLLSVLLTLIMLMGCLPLSVLAEGLEEVPAPLVEDFILAEAGEDPTTENIARNKPVTVSGTAVDAENSGQELTDGNMDFAVGGWLSEDLKKDGTTEQTPVWAVIDLGEGTHPISSIVLQWRNNKVWSTCYEIQTSATNGDDAQWETVARVERAPADAKLTQGNGQNIANPQAYQDTITTVTTPALQTTELQRYVRFYCFRVNELAPGKNLNLSEIQIFGASAPETISFSDDFEDGVDAGWTFTGNGAVSEEQNHTEGGSKSFKMNANTPEANVSLSWRTEKPVQGTVSLWYYDTMTPKTTTNTMQIAFLQSKDAPGIFAGIGVNNANAAGAGKYLIRNPGAGDYAATSVSRTKGWHEFKWDCSDGKSMKMYIDGTLVKTLDNIASFDSLTICDNWSGSAAPGYYDDVQIQGSRAVEPALDAKGALATITEMPSVPVSATQVPMPEVPDGFTLSVIGSELEQVVTNDGTILGTNIGKRDVTLLLEIVNNADETDTAQKNLTVTIPDHSGSDVYAGTGWFEEQGSNPRPGIVPSVQEWYGYDGSFTLTEGSKIVLNDAANVGLDKVAANMVEDVKEISGITLTVTEGTAADAGPNDIYIESQTDDVYKTGKEGYVLVTDEAGLQIYSSTYVGCLYGTISAEQMLWLSENDRSIPTGVIRDFPAYEVRGIFLDIARTDYRLELLYDYSDIMLWYKMNEFHAHLADNRSVKDAGVNGVNHTDLYEGFHRLESTTFKSLKPETKKSASIDHTATDYFEQIYEVPYYTQEEWKDFQKYSADQGVYILNELDMPGHSLAYNRYAQENPNNIDWLRDGGTGNATEKELLDLIGPNKDRALQFASTLWDEYTEGPDPVFQGDIVHIGADEYWDRKAGTADAFINFAETMRKTVRDNGKSEKVRMWASFGRMGIPAEDLAPLAPYYQIDMWSTNNDNPVPRSAQGFEIVNCVDVYMYGNPGRDRRDIVNAEYVYDNWDPTIFGGSSNLLVGDPNLLGGKTALWGDESQEGMIELDIHQRIMRAVPVTSEKTWGGTQEDTSFTEFELRANELAEGPGTQIAMDTDSKSALVAHYDFANVSEDGSKVYDISGNGYDATLGSGAAADGWLTFNGGTPMETTLKTIPYPFTLSFDVKLTQADIDANAATYGDGNAVNDANLFSGYDGRLQPAGFNGNLSGDVNYFTRDFKYQIPADQAVNITLVGTMHGTKLYVDGKLETFVSQKVGNLATYPPNSMANVFSSMVLPLEKIGENLHGSLADIKVYNKALSAEEIAAEAGLTEGSTLVNVAQGTGATSYQGVGADQAVNRLYYAAKAVDGDGFDYTNPADEGDKNKNSELNSCWYGFKANSYLVVDLGQARRIDQTLIQWKGNNYAREYQIETSMDGETWDVVYTGSASDRDENGVSHGSFAPVTARYVKFQGIRFNGGRYDIQEFLVCQNVDKTELNTLLAEAETAAAERGLSFTSTGADKAAFDALLFARSASANPIATYEEVYAAIEGLSLLGVESVDASLRYIAVNGKTLEGFDPEKTDYTFTVMPPEVEQEPVITYEATRPGAKVTVSGVGALPCLVTITVTAPDGKETRIYTVDVQKGDYRSVGYCFGYSDTEEPFWDVDPNEVTHLVYCFGRIYHDEKVNGNYRPGGILVPEDQPELLGTLALTDAAKRDLAAMPALKEVNPDLKIMLSVGGGTCPGWADATATPEARAKFIASCVAAVEEYNLDGIDLDWEFPGHGNAIDHNPNDKANFEALIREMRAALGEDKIFSIATSSKDFYLTTSCNLPAVIEYLDFANIMSYTMANHIDCYHNSALYNSVKFPAGPNTSLESCDEVMRYFTDAGCPAEKLNVGTAFFSKIPPVAGKKLDVDTLKQELGISGITMSYPQLLEKVLENPDSKFVREWDNDAKVPYLTYPDQKGVPQFAITYEDPESMGYKAQFIQQNGYGGAVIWQMRQDHNYILQSALNDALNGKDDFVVTFDSCGGSAVGAVSVQEGSKVLEPEAPIRSGYAFAGWYTDPEYTTLWDFESGIVERNLTLYAKWDAVSSSSFAITVESSDNGAVTASRTRAPKGLTITLTVKPDEGCKLDKLTVTDKNGNELKLTDKGDDKYTFAMPASAVTVKASFTKDDGSVGTGLPFTDVAKKDWFYEAVKYAYDNKLMDGTSSTTFAPLMTTNRAMVVTMLWRLEGQPKAEATLSFTDVEQGVWYTDAVNWAAAEGIVKGYSDTVFAPNDTVSREQLATILYRYAEYKEYDVSAKGDLTAFTDGAKTSSWAAQAMEWAVGSGLLTGKGGNVLDPTGTATRAEVAQILMRFAEGMK